jgi:uncharacterized membrane protein
LNYGAVETDAILGCFSLKNPKSEQNTNDDGAFADIYPMPATGNRFLRFPAVILLLYLFLCVLMLQIIGQYIPAGTDTAFLAIKQDYIQVPGYLWAFYIHVFTAVLALPAGFTQFSKTLLRKRPQLHRGIGKIYVVSIIALGAPSGFYIGLYANGGLSSRIAFCLLALLWLYCTAKAWQQAVNKNFRQHRAFMYRSFALTLSAITLRAWKYLLAAAFHPHPMDLYRLVAWLGWTLNLVIAEWIIYKKLQP